MILVRGEIVPLLHAASATELFLYYVHLEIHSLILLSLFLPFWANFGQVMSTRNSDQMSQMF